MSDIYDQFCYDGNVFIGSWYDQTEWGWIKPIVTAFLSERNWPLDG